LVDVSLESAAWLESVASLFLVFFFLVLVSEELSAV